MFAFVGTKTLQSGNCYDFGRTTSCVKLFLDEMSMPCTLECLVGNSTWKMEENHYRTYPRRSIFKEENFCSWGECKILEISSRVVVCKELENSLTVEVVSVMTFEYFIVKIKS